MDLKLLALPNIKGNQQPAASKGKKLVFCIFP